jgi:hypothetical protein
MTLVPRIVEGLKENGADDVLVIVGGTILTWTDGAPCAPGLHWAGQVVKVSRT